MDDEELNHDLERIRWHVRDTRAKRKVGRDALRSCEERLAELRRRITLEEKKTGFDWLRDLRQQVKAVEEEIEMQKAANVCFSQHLRELDDAHTVC